MKRLLKKQTKHNSLTNLTLEKLRSWKIKGALKAILRLITLFLCKACDKALSPQVCSATNQNPTQNQHNPEMQWQYATSGQLHTKQYFRFPELSKLFLFKPIVHTLVNMRRWPYLDGKLLPLQLYNATH